MQIFKTDNPKKVCTDEIPLINSRDTTYTGRYNGDLDRGRYEMEFKSNVNDIKAINKIEFCVV